jgi:hypothetical protein
MRKLTILPDFSCRQISFSWPLLPPSSPEPYGSLWADGQSSFSLSPRLRLSRYCFWRRLFVRWSYSKFVYAARTALFEICSDSKGSCQCQLPVSVGPEEVVSAVSVGAFAPILQFGHLQKVMSGIFVPKPKGQRPVGTTPIVAWHEVPGNAFLKEPCRRVRYDRRSCSNRCFSSNVCRVSQGRLNRNNTA